MTIIYSDETQISSAKVLSKCNNNEIYLSLNSFVNSSLESSLKEITFITHTIENRKLFGENLTPEKFAHLFAKAFKKRDKDELEDLYFIGCEAGLCETGKKSLAQQIAIKMHEQGFSKLRVHAITNPFDLSMIELKVGVANKGGSLPWEFPGDIIGLAYENEYTQKIENEVDELESNGEKNNKNFEKLKSLEALKKDPQYKNTLFFSAIKGTYKEELNQPYHTYTKNGSQGIYSLIISQTIIFLNQKKVILELENSKKSEKYIKAINDLLEIIHQNAEINREQLLILINIEKAKTRSNTINSIIINLIDELHLTKHPNQGAFFTVPSENKKTHLPLNRRIIKQELQNYITIREKEWDFHYNFLGILTVIYSLYDFVSGTDYFKSIHKKTKLSAAHKLVARLSGENPIPLNDLEINAFQDKRLADIVNKYGGIDTIWNSAKSINQVNAQHEQQKEFLTLAN